MLSLKYIRKNRIFITKNILLKKFHCNINDFFQLDKERKKLLIKIEKIKSEKNKINRIISKNIKSENLSRLSKDFILKMKELTLKEKSKKKKFNQISKEWLKIYLSIPNIFFGKNENNKIIKVFKKRDNHKNKKSYFEIKNINKYIDLTIGSKVSGKGFAFYIGELALLIRTLINFFMDEAVKHFNCKEIITPYLVNQNSVLSTGHFPDKENQMYKIKNGSYYLIPTAEVPLTNFYRDAIIENCCLPIKYVAYTPCFRKEAGSWGLKNKGINRLHQFDKVEIVEWVHPNKSNKELQLLVSYVENLIKKLELDYRILLIGSKKIGFAQGKQYDLEVWANGQKKWLEVSSCSNYFDFQSRRLNTKFIKTKNQKKGSNSFQYVHTINGSALAIPRILVAILEKNIDLKRKIIKIPKILSNRMGKKYIKI
jgi:seryl-tRNA synthetase